MPGAMRSVKFIRHLKGFKVHVLTVSPDLYPASVMKNLQMTLPLNNEAIYYTGIIDIFIVFLKIRDWLKILFGKENKAPDNHNNLKSVFVNPENKSVSEKTINHSVRDFVYNACYFPDQAGPWLLPAFLKGWSVARKNNVKVIFATGMPWTGLVVGWLLHLATGKPFIADFRDPWIGNPFHKSKGRLFDALSAFFEKKVIRGAAVVAANTETLRKEFISRYPELHESHFITLPNGYDESDFSGLDTNSETLSDELVLCHAGFLYGFRDPAPLLKAVRSFNKNNKCNGQRVIFKQIGRFDLHYDFEERFRDLVNDGSLVVISECPYDECLKMLARADILVNVQLGTINQIPSKLYDYLALNKPILNLAPVQGALGNMVWKHGFGELFEGDDHEKITEYLSKMFVKKKTQKMDGWFYGERVKFDIRTITKQLHSKFKELIG